MRRVALTNDGAAQVLVDYSVGLPCLKLCDLKLVIQLCHCHSLDIELLVMGLDRDCRPILILPNVVAFHPAPVAPLECDGGWPRVHFEDLPCEIRHHVAEGVVGIFELGVLRAVVFVWSDDGGVCASRKASCQHLHLALPS